VSLIRPHNILNTVNSTSLYSRTNRASPLFSDQSSKLSVIRTRTHSQVSSYQLVCITVQEVTRRHTRGSDEGIAVSSRFGPTSSVWLLILAEIRTLISSNLIAGQIRSPNSHLVIRVVFGIPASDFASDSRQFQEPMLCQHTSASGTPKAGSRASIVFASRLRLGRGSLQPRNIVSETCLDYAKTSLRIPYGSMLHLLSHPVEIG
jgi:hypothetical protein